jgi:hypothetical protein
MKQLDENTLWKYLDGDCNEEERLQMESLLSTDSALAEELLLRTTLHEQMGDLELEQPSANFSANVMAAIPNKKIVISPVESLISPMFKKVFFAISSLLLAVLISAPFFLGGSATLAPTRATARPGAEVMQSLAEWMSAVLASIASYLPSMPNIPAVPDSIIQMSGLLLVGFVVLLVFDVAIKRRTSF